MRWKISISSRILSLFERKQDFVSFFGDFSKSFSYHYRKAWMTSLSLCLDDFSCLHRFSSHQYQIGRPGVGTTWRSFPKLRRNDAEKSSAMMKQTSTHNCALIVGAKRKEKCFIIVWFIELGMWQESSRAKQLRTQNCLDDEGCHTNQKMLNANSRRELEIGGMRNF